MGKIALSIFACLVLLMIYRIILYVVIHRKAFGKYIKSDDCTFFGLVSMIDFRWIFIDRKSDKQPMNEYVRADAKVIDKESSVYECYDEAGNLLKKINYTLKVKFYAGNQCVTTNVESDKYDENIEICYNVKNPYEVYLADDKRFGDLSKNESIEGTFSVLWSFLGYVAAAIAVFSMFT